jgi:hypothetical protein
MSCAEISEGDIGETVRRPRVIGIRLSDDEFDSVLRLRGACPIPEVPLSIFLRSVLMSAASASAVKQSAGNKGTPKKSKAVKS